MDATMRRRMDEIRWNIVPATDGELTPAEPTPLRGALIPVLRGPCLLEIVAYAPAEAARVVLQPGDQLVRHEDGHVWVITVRPPGAGTAR